MAVAQAVAGGLAGRVVVVSGGGTGIGAASAERLAADGASLVLVGRRREPLERVAASTGAAVVVGDVADPATSEGAVAVARERFGRIDAVVANAGIEAMGAALEVDLGEWHRVMEVNVDGVLHLCRAALPTMIEAGRGSIVVVSSVSGRAGAPSYAAYVTSKTAVIGLVRSMAYDYGPSGVRVNALCPGWVATEMSEREVEALAELQGSTPEQARRSLVQHLPLGRMAEPSEIAGCVRFLVGDDSSFVTGAVLVADGGGEVVDVGTLAFRD